MFLINELNIKDVKTDDSTTQAPLIEESVTTTQEIAKEQFQCWLEDIGGQQY